MSHSEAARIEQLRSRLEQQNKPSLELRQAAAEAEVHSAIVTWIKTVAPQILIFHPANGGWRSKAEGARLKGLGVTPGIPDLCIIAPGGVFFAEVKNAAGRLSEPLREIHAWLTRLGCPVAAVRSIGDMRAAFRRWHIATREHDPLAHLNPKTREAWRQSAMKWRAERDETERGG